MAVCKRPTRPAGIASPRNRTAPACDALLRGCSAWEHGRQTAPAPTRPGGAAGALLGPLAAPPCFAARSLRVTQTFSVLGVPVERTCARWAARAAPLPLAAGSLPLTTLLMSALSPHSLQYPYGYDQSAYYASYYGQQGGWQQQQQQQQQYGAWQQQQQAPPPPDQPPLPPGEPPPPPPPGGQQQAPQTQQQAQQQGYGWQGDYSAYYQQV